MTLTLVNPVGQGPASPKRAVVTARHSPGTFRLVDTSSRRTLYEERLNHTGTVADTDDRRYRIADKRGGQRPTRPAVELLDQPDRRRHDQPFGQRRNHDGHRLVGDPPGFSGYQMYFKAGDYDQTYSDDPSVGATVQFYALNVYHGSLRWRSGGEVSSFPVSGRPSLCSQLRVEQLGEVGLAEPARPRQGRHRLPARPRRPRGRGLRDYLPHPR